MAMKKLYAIWTVLPLLAISCDREDHAIVPASPNVKIRFSASMEEVKTTLDDDGTVQWEEGDVVRVYWSSEGSATMTALQSGSRTEFSDVSVGETDRYYAVYPDSNQSVDTAGEKVRVNIPSWQDGSFASANPIVGRTLPGSGLIYFYYACSVLKFNITRSDITEVVIRSADGSAIAGSVTADFSSVAAASDIPEFSVADGADEITVIISGPGTYYVALLPGKAVSGGLLFRARTTEDYLPAAASGLNQASVRGKVKNYVVSGGMDSKIVTDYYVSSTGAGNKNGKSAANAFDPAGFRQFVESRASDPEASRSQAFRLYGTTFHVIGTVPVSSSINIGFAPDAYEKTVVFAVTGGTLSGNNTTITVGNGAAVDFSGITLSGVTLSGSNISAGFEGYNPGEYDWEGEGSQEETEALENNQIKVISFNVKTNKGDLGQEHAWDSRFDAVIEMFKTENPTVFGLQEARYSQVTDLRYSLRAYSSIGVSRDDGKATGSGEHMMVFYKTSDLTLRSWGTFWLSPTPSSPSLGWDDSETYRRCATWAIFTHKKTNKQFFFVDTHLGLTSLNRRNGASLIISKIAELNASSLPVVLTGDMNATLPSDDLAPLETKLGNLRENAPLTDHVGTYTDFGRYNNRIIDYIYYSDLIPVRYRTVNGSWLGVTYISDHYPVSGILQFRN